VLLHFCLRRLAQKKNPNCDAYHRRTAIFFVYKKTTWGDVKMERYHMHARLGRPLRMSKLTKLAARVATGRRQHREVVVETDNR
jgi:hypothetical protein